MALSKLILSLFFSSILVLLPRASAQNSNLFTEYIGVSYKDVQFTNVPINSATNFHFLLAFAIDYTSDAVATNDQFSIYWQNSVLTPDAVAAIKSSNPNVKVGLSLGGATIGSSSSNVVFSATFVSSWVDNAVSSLTQIIKDNGLDEIDIDYDHFSNGDTDTFLQCIGQLIMTLRKNEVISFASIAPFDDPTVQTRYQALWASYSGVIDYVNFQFYAYDSSTTVDQFLGYFNTQLSNYNGAKVLASFTIGVSTGAGGGLSPANGFFDACSTLKSENKLAGIFVWSADTTFANGGNYQSETLAQQLVASA